ncbi:MAG: hypothetical protein Q9165_002753 [Trypethelium subeluteriae]
MRLAFYYYDILYALESATWTMARLHEESDEELPDLQAIINQHAQKTWPHSQPSTCPNACTRRATNRKPSQRNERSGSMERDYHRNLSSAGRGNNLKGLVSRIDRLEYKAPRGLSQLPIHPAPLKATQVKATESEPESQRDCFSPSTSMTPSRLAKKNISYHDSRLSPSSALGVEEDFINESNTDSNGEWKTENFKNRDDVFGSSVQVRRTAPSKELMQSRNCQEAHSIANRKQNYQSEGTAQLLGGQNKAKHAPRLNSCGTDSGTSSDKQAHVPAPPHRPSLDSFWNQEIVNEWSEQHSPRKILHSPSKYRFFDTLREIPADDGDGSDLNLPTSSPRKNRTRSPKKTAIEKRVAGERKTFESEKHGIASSFLGELDDKITDGRIGRLANDGSGVRLEWNRKLNSTAGRAHWKKEGRREASLPGQEKGELKFRHEAKIELAEKVIDCEERLINVIAHEFCHLACFMISGIRDNPHGKEFKAWARKCTAAFAHRNIEVTTKHSYVIDYKYVWACTSCGNEYKRHSKSIDTSRHACGSCRAKLIQIKPVPRGTKGPTEYQEFVKKVFKDVKQKNPGLKHGEIMEIVGRMYRESKAARNEGDGRSDKATDMKVDGLVKQLEIFVIEDD